MTLDCVRGSVLDDVAQRWEKRESDLAFMLLVDNNEQVACAAREGKGESEAEDAQEKAHRFIDYTHTHRRAVWRDVGFRRAVTCQKSSVLFSFFFFKLCSLFFFVDRRSIFISV